MCTYHTVTLPVSGSGKAAGGAWFKLAEGMVYFDHPVHAPAEHTLNIDLFPSAPGAGEAGERVAIELTAASALELCQAIQRALDAVPSELRQEVSGARA